MLENVSGGFFFLHQQLSVREKQKAKSEAHDVLNAVDITDDAFTKKISD